MRLESATEPATQQRHYRPLRFNSLRADCATVATVAAFSSHCTDALYGGDRTTSTLAHHDRCRDRFDVCALDRSAFYKRRPTPKPGLDLSDHRLCGLLCKFVSRFLPKLCGKDASAVADLSQILPQTYRRCAEREPCFDSMACCARSMSCSRAALHIAPCSLRQGQAAHRASRGGRSLPIGDAGNRRKTCPALNQEFRATKAKRGKSQPARATSGLGGLRAFGFLRASLAPVIQGKLEDLR